MPTDDILAIVGRADELYHLRHEPGAVRESVMVLSGARGATERYEVQWRLARALFFLGQEASSRDASRELYSAGIEAGERSVALNRSRVEGHFWLGVNLALFAETTGGIRGARALRRARLELEEAAAINETYHDAGPLRVLGRLAHKAPRILGGSVKRSREFFDRALRIAPSNSVTLIYAVDLALETGESDRAASLLHHVLDAPVDPDWQFENRRDREAARSLLERLGTR
ncbi:MAG TPA: TRAP transporter TatT component family protein [Blastocatellia bacterium]|nr:TRAP transporter TatT component family protein [Blastocatellia bacterium]